ncbi:MAG: hypothetical protein IJB86_11125 [Clostridia bacterium]|nr:hypothetical protein [Clostridia bacterium]
MSDYAQLAKNNVDSENQLKDSDIVRFYNPSGKGVRVMFVGNSMTLHGIKEDIGWHIECGMAASCPENDYVHLMMKEIDRLSVDASYCICQVAQWECNYASDEVFCEQIQNARSFSADIIIFRAIENCPTRGFEASVFMSQLHKLLSYLDRDNKAKIVMTTGFWRHPGDDVIIEYANKNKLPLVLLGDLGDLDEMKALGLFEHIGVANHPGDLGMRCMADRIMSEVKKVFVMVKL